MKNRKLFALLVVAVFIVATAAPLCAAATLSKPNFTLPSGWELMDETPYPEVYGEYDEEGAGLVEYGNTATQEAYVMIYYEKAPSQSFSNADLQGDVEYIFARDDSGITMTSSGVTTIAGVSAGYAKGYDYGNDVYIVEYVFVKDNYYINAYAQYEVLSSEDQVLSLLNSMNSGVFGIPLLYIIIILVVVVVVVVVVVLLMKRKKKATSAVPMYQGGMPIPPPPPA